MYAATVFSALVATLALLNGADAHGYVSSPKATVTGGSTYTSFSAEFTAAQVGNAAFNGKPFNRSPGQNAQEFTTAFKASGIKDLKTIIDAKVTGCGKTDPNGPVQDVSNLKTMDFQNNEYKEGFLGSHEGPCEVWIDNTRVFQDDNCAKNFKSYPAKLPVDYSKCSGTCRLTFYWLALHGEKWQAYKYCVPIKNGSGGGGGGGNGGNGGGGNGGGGNGGGGGGGGAPSATPAAGNTKPAVVAPEANLPSKKPAAAPAPAPAPAPAAPPAPSKKSCKRRARLL
jgi:uncharacterized membrane protein YgcG